MKSASPSAAVWLLAAMAPALWGTTYFVTQFWLPGADPLWLATLRIVVPGILMLPFVPLSVWRRRWWHILVLSSLNIGVFTVLLFAGIQRLPGGMAATLTSSMPLQLLLIRALMGRFPTPVQLLAAVGGMAGVALLVWQSPTHVDWTGVFCSLSAATIMSVGVLLIPVLGKGIKPLVLTSAQLSSAGIILLIVALLSGHPVPHLDTGGLLAMAWLGPVTMGGGYFIWFRAVSQLPVDKVAFLGLINPVVAVSGGVLVMGEVMSLAKAFAIVLVLACVLISQHPSARRS